MIEFNAKIVNLENVRADLMRLLEELGDKAVDQFLRRAGALAKQSLRKTFAVGGRPAWAPLSAATIERRRYVASTKGAASSRSHLYGRAGKEMEAKLAKAKSDKISYSGRLNLLNRAMIPLGGPKGTFAKSVRVKRLGGQQVYIGPPWSGRLGDRMDLYTLWKLHAEGSSRLPARRMDYLQPGDEGKIVRIAEDVVDKALKIKPSGAKGGRLSEFFRTDLTAVA